MQDAFSVSLRVAEVLTVSAFWKGQVQRLLWNWSAIVPPTPHDPITFWKYHCEHMRVLRAIPNVNSKVCPIDSICCAVTFIFQWFLFSFLISSIAQFNIFKIGYLEVCYSVSMYLCISHLLCGDIGDWCQRMLTHVFSPFLNFILRWNFAKLPTLALNLKSS